jgi:hypothetical protein
MMTDTTHGMLDLFFATQTRCGRQLVDKLDARGRGIFGPWRDRRLSDAGPEWSFREVSPEMIDLHVSGKLLYRSERARLQTYGVSENGTSVWTAVDLDVTAGGKHSNQPQHFATTEEAVHAALRVRAGATQLGIQSWLEITKSGGIRVWVFFAEPVSSADAYAFGKLLVLRGGLHPSTEVFPNTLTPFASPVLLPYAGVAAVGRQIVLDPATKEPMPISEFIAGALAGRTPSERIAAIVDAAVGAGEVKRLAEGRMSTQGNCGPADDADAARRWRAILAGCARLRSIVERAEAGQPLDYFDWAIRLLPHLKALGEWGHAEFHRLSAFDQRYSEAECEIKFDSLDGGPTRCDKMGCSLDPHADCGLPVKWSSPVYFASQATSRERTDWEDPIPLGDHKLPPFPLEVLPPALAGFVRDVAVCTQVPADMPAMLALAVVAAAGARRCLVRIGDTHSEPLNLYVCVVMEPGSRKSQTLDQVTAPLRAFEREEYAKMEPVITASRSEREIQETRLRNLRATSAKCNKPTDREALSAQIQEITENIAEVPVAPRLLADDVTPEKLASIMAQQAGVMAIFSAEGGIFGTLAGRYSDGKANLDLFLKAHAGEEYRCDRQNRPSEFVRNCCLTMGLTVQTDVIASMAEHASFRGRGLLGRFLYSIPEDLVGDRLYQNRRPNLAAADLYAAAIASILQLPEADPVDPVSRHTLTISGASLEIWAEYANEVERRQKKGADLYEIRDWASKLAGAAARIAGCLHLVAHAGGKSPWSIPISPENVAAAWAVAEYLVPHAQTAYGRMGAEATIAQARRLLAWITRCRSETFSQRSCQQALRSNRAPLDLTDALHLLCEHRYIRPLPATRTGEFGGRPKSTEYEVNPALRTRTTRGQEVSE